MEKRMTGKSDKQSKHGKQDKKAWKKKNRAEAVSVLCCMAALLWLLTGCAGGNTRTDGTSKETSSESNTSATIDAAQDMDNQAGTNHHAEEHNDTTHHSEEYTNISQYEDENTDSTNATHHPEEHTNASQNTDKYANTTHHPDEHTNTSQYTDDSTNTTHHPEEHSSTGHHAGEHTNVQADIGPEQAKDAALTHAGLNASDVTFTKEKLDYDDGRAEYEIEFVTDTTKYEYEIKADDGKILESSKEPVVQIEKNVQAQITPEDAKAAALNDAGLDESQVKFTKLKLEYDDGRAEYEIEFFVDRTEYSFTIDAESGAVLEMESETD